MKVRVYYEDTDLGGVVYHSKYLNFCERARSELFFEKGKSPVWQDHHFVVQKLEAIYHKPAFLGDILEIKTNVVKIKRTNLTLLQTIQREGETIFELTVTLVCLKGNKPTRIPHYFLEIFDENHL